MNRRGFLGAILAATVAPAIVRADSLMRIVPRDTGIVLMPWQIHYARVNLNEDWMARAEQYSDVVKFTHDTPQVRVAAMRLANIHLDETERAINRPIVAREYVWLPPDSADKTDCMPQAGWLVAKGFA